MGVKDCLFCFLSTNTVSSEVIAIRVIPIKFRRVLAHAKSLSCVLHALRVSQSNIRTSAEVAEGIREGGRIDELRHGTGPRAVAEENQPGRDHVRIDEVLL